MEDIQTLLRKIIYAKKLKFLTAQAQPPNPEQPLFYDDTIRF